jgi:hypothetical protein
MNGLFMTNHLHDVVHLVTGLILLGVGLWASAQSGLWFKILGIVYLLVAVVGFLMAPNGGDVLGLSMNMTDHIFHVVVGVVFLLVGFMGPKGMKAVSAMPAAPASGPSTGSTM